jgi:two-component system, sensor histidine kinase and response regulator
MDNLNELEHKKRELENVIESWQQERQNFQQIQQEWQENKERWQLILQGGNDGIWDWNVRTQTLFVSPRWKEMLGYSDGEIAHHFDTWKSLLHPEDVDRVFDCLQAYLNQEIPEYRVEFRLLCKDGNYKWILARGEALWDESGQPLRMAGSHTDINERKQREKGLEIQAERDNILSRITRLLIAQDIHPAIHHTLELLCQFTQSARCYIIQYSTCRQQWSMVYEYCNPDYPEVIPIQEDSQSLSTETFPWFSEQLLNGIPVKLNSLADLPAAAIAERIILADSPTPCLLIVPMGDSQGVTVGYLGLDANRKKQWTREDVNFVQLVGELIAIAEGRDKAETALKEAKEGADRANRAKSEFLANMSHELRTPLNAILGFTRLMVRDSSLSSEQRQYLEIVNRSGEHLLELINDILEMSKIEAGRTVFNPSNFDLYALLDNIAEMLQPQAEEKALSLIFDRTPELPQYICTDESKLRQVLINLLGNGLKFTPTGGVTLRGKAGEKREDYQRLLWEIEDTGAGIAQEEIFKLFQPFNQTETGRKSQQGTGLGLPISKKFVELMGGTIRVNSILGQGSVFSFDIVVNLVGEDQIKNEIKTRKVIALADNQPKYRILVVDDRSESRLLLLKLLATVGLSVQEAANGQEAIAIWQAWQPHLIWMDMRMPIKDGYEATREIRSLEGKNRGKTVIIALTASAFEEDRALVIAAGCDDFVGKPFREEVIWQKMTEYLGLEYVYADNEPNQPNYSPVFLDFLQSLLQFMTPEWIKQLQQAAQECDDEKIIALTAEIPPNYANLAQGLQQLASQFSFDAIETIIAGLKIS